MQSFRAWEELCALRVAAQWEEDGACLALTAKFVAGSTPTASELDRWHRARERSSHVYARMRAHASPTGPCETAVEPSVDGTARPSFSHEPSFSQEISGPTQRLLTANLVGSQKSDVERGLPV